MVESFGSLFAKEFGKRNNPTDMKSGIIGKVVQVEPVIVSIDNGKVLLKENNELEISEWFRFRCNIDTELVENKKRLSDYVTGEVASAGNVSETHSYPANKGATCLMPMAIDYLANAIKAIQSELLALKLELKKGDYVSVSSLEENGKYVLLDKVL